MRIYDGLFVNALERKIGQKIDNVKPGETFMVNTDGLYYVVTIPALNFPRDILAIETTEELPDDEVFNPIDYNRYPWLAGVGRCA